MGSVQNTIHFVVAAEETVELDAIIGYAMRRVETAVKDVMKTDDRLLDSRILERWQPKMALNREKKKSALMQKISAMQEAANEDQRELLSFLQDELRTTAPRRRIIEAVLVDVAENEELVTLIHNFLTE
jgi:translation initiation factor 2 beta subunit (eIF-2beta)/eIF-5